MPKQKFRRKFQRRGGGLRRPAAIRDPLPRILVVCEGGKTEPKYIEDFKSHHRNGAVLVETIGTGLDPQGVVDRAIRRKLEAEAEAKNESDDFLKFDQIWCLVDIDDHDAHRLQIARDRARANIISLVVSNPCFELWGLYHFQDQDGPISTAHIQRQLKTHIRRYNKQLPYDLIKDQYETAKIRGQNSINNRINDGIPNGNPSTSVQELTETILEYGQAERWS